MESRIDTCTCRCHYCVTVAHVHAPRTMALHAYEAVGVEYVMSNVFYTMLIICDIIL